MNFKNLILKSKNFKIIQRVNTNYGPQEFIDEWCNYKGTKDNYYVFKTQKNDLYLTFLSDTKVRFHEHGDVIPLEFTNFHELADIDYTIKDDKITEIHLNNVEQIY